MDEIERERMTKAHQCAQLLLSDLRDVFTKTDSVAVQELMEVAIQQVSTISRWLGRLAKQDGGQQP